MGKFRAQHVAGLLRVSGGLLRAMSRPLRRTLASTSVRGNQGSSRPVAGVVRGTEAGGTRP